MYGLHHFITLISVNASPIDTGGAKLRFVDYKWFLIERLISAFLDGFHLNRNQIDGAAGDEHHID